MGPLEHLKRLILGKKSPQDFGAIGDGNADDTAALRSFIRFVEKHDVACATVHGRFRITDSLSMTDPATRNFHGYCRIIFEGKADEVFTISDFENGYWEQLSITCPGSTTDYSSRTCSVGLRLINSRRARFGRIETQNCAFAGVAVCGGNNNVLGLGEVQGFDCGSGSFHDANASLHGEWSPLGNTGGSGSTGQRTRIRVNQLPPSYVVDGNCGQVGDIPLLVKIEDDLHFIYNVDVQENTLEIFPWISAQAVPGRFDYVFGGAAYLHGSDTGVVGIDVCDGIRCGANLVAASLYGPSARRIVSQNCGIGLLVGNDPEAASLGGHFDGSYFEGNFKDIVVIQRQGVSGYGYFGAEYALNLEKCLMLGAPRRDGGELSPTLQGFDVSPLRYRGGDLRRRGQKFGRNELGSSLNVNPADYNAKEVFRADNLKILITEPDENINRLFGNDCTVLAFFGTGNKNQPMGTISFNMSNNNSWQINGHSAVDFSGFSGPVEFWIYFDFGRSAVNITCIKCETVDGTPA